MSRNQDDEDDEEEVQWREDLPDEWEDVPEDPPERDAGTKQEDLGNGAVVRGWENANEYVYADSEYLVQDDDAFDEDPRCATDDEDG